MSVVREMVVIPDDVEEPRAAYAGFLLFETLASRAAARKACKRGLLLVDGAECGWGTHVEPGQTLTLLEPPPRAGVTVYPRELTVVYEDDAMAVLDKPAGLPVNGWRPRTFENALPHNLQPTGAKDALSWPRPVHRLDARTTGLVVVAKTSAAVVGLSRSFQERRVDKRYRAIVSGRLEQGGAVQEAIDGRDAHTRFEVAEHTRSLKAQWTTTLNVWPETGRTHQIRRHLSGLGHPILGDGRYGDGLRGHGLFLQAIAIGLDHPLTGEPLSLELPELPRFRSFRKRELRRWLKYNPE